MPGRATRALCIVWVLVRSVGVAALCGIAACGVEGDAAPAREPAARAVFAQAPSRDFRPESKPVPWNRFAPGVLLVRFKDDALFRNKAQSLALVGAKSANSYRTIPGLHRVVLGDGLEVSQAASMLARREDIEYAEPSYIVREFAVPDDPQFPQQWALQNLGGGCCELTPDADIDATDAWGTTTGSADVVVGVVDSGVDYLHPDLAENMYASATDCNVDGIDQDGSGFADDCHGVDFVDDDSEPLDPREHGTHVAGIIGARGNNGIGVSGVAWDVRIVACRFINDEGEGEIADAVACLDYMAAMHDRGVNIVATNHSWGGGPPSRALDAAIRAHRDRGMLVVTAAGNDMADNDRFPVYPCEVDYSNVVCVGASGWRDGPAFFTNRGRRTVDLYAPGEVVLSTIPNNAYAMYDGTSMAAPQVTGAVALLAAREPSADWRKRRNLLLSTVDRPSQFFADYSVSGGRLNVAKALNCTDAELLAPLKPVATERIVRAIDTPLLLQAIHVRCGDPAGPVQVSVSPGSGTTTLADDGAGVDEIAGDGIYAGEWSSPDGGEFELSIVGSTAPPLVVTVDPMLRRGFPVTMLATEPFVGATIYGPGMHVLVGELDGDPNLEIVASGIHLGPLYAWNDDGSALPGWPALDAFGTAYPVLGEFDGDPDSLEVASFSFSAGTRIYDDDAIVLPGWPQPAQGLLGPNAAADLDSDGLDELIGISVVRSDGEPFGDSELPVFDKEKFPPDAVAVADLDGDGVVELIVNTETGVWASNVAGLFPGFPVKDPRYLGNSQVAPVVGDVDGDGAPEIVTITSGNGNDYGFVGSIYAWNGVLKHSIPFLDEEFPTLAALADLDADGVPEIVIFTEREIRVFRGDGTELPGWPFELDTRMPGVNTIYRGSFTPIVGDLNGDDCPEVVTLTGDFLVEDLYPYNGNLRVIDCNGHELPGFPKPLPTMRGGVTPAIADLDRDGRNELIVSTVPIEGERDFLFVYELERSRPHGSIEWGQYMGEPKHSGYYPLGKNLATRAFLSTQVHGAGRVRAAGGSIDCGNDCIGRYAKGTTVTLTATPDAGFEFKGWRGACTGLAASCTVAVGAETRVSAWFSVPLRVALTGTGTGRVTSLPAGIDCPIDCDEVLAERTSVTLTASADSGSDFDGWSGACNGLQPTCVVVPEGDTKVVARFVNGRTLTVARTGEGQGRITSMPSGINCGATCSAAFPPFSTVTLTAVPNADSYVEFWNWPGCANYSWPDCTVQMTTDVTITPKFSKKPVLTVLIDGEDKGVVVSDPAGIRCPPDCVAPMPKDEVIHLLAQPKPGSTVTGFSGGCVTNSDRCEFFMFNTMTVMVHFMGTPDDGGGGGGGGGGNGGGSGGGGNGGGGGPAGIPSLLGLALLQFLRRRSKSQD